MEFDEGLECKEEEDAGRDSLDGDGVEEGRPREGEEDEDGFFCGKEDGEIEEGFLSRESDEGFFGGRISTLDFSASADGSRSGEEDSGRWVKVDESGMSVDE